MIKYENLKNGSLFSVLFYEIKPFNSNSDLKQKYSLKYYQHGDKKSIMFIKDDNFTCHELNTKEVFTLDDNKMINEKTGLYFLGNYVDNTNLRRHEDASVVKKFFEDAEYYKNNKQMTLVK